MTPDQTTVFVKRVSNDAKRELVQQNEARTEAGLKPITIVVRTCLSCGILFESMGRRTCGCVRDRL